MIELYYKDALKLGQKAYKADTARGVSPCLPVLDDLVPPEKSAAGTDLGIVTIPAELIVGTKTRGRTNAFASNFMPIMDEGTEFSNKWEALSHAHMEEGIRDPVKVYEYMHRYYVEEGNKRVSVLKFFGAAEIAAHVIRVLPERTPETEVYYEYIAFYRYSSVNFLEFTKKGSYASLLRCVGKAPEEKWTDDERRKLRASYYYFLKAYKSLGGDKLQTAPGDAFLAYIEIYDYQSISDMTQDEIKKNVSKMWEELTLKQEAEPVEVKTAPVEEKKQGLITKVLSKSVALNAAFLYDRSTDVAGWSYEHELGRKYAQYSLGDKVKTTPYQNVLDGDPIEAIEKAIADGNNVIFTTSPRLMQASLRAAIDHPEAVIMNCSLNTPHRYIRTYSARMFEAKFIAGAVAGSMSKNGKLGYICDYPIFGQIAGINAFALGAQMVNPRAKIYLEWTAVKGNYDLTALFERRNISLISAQDTQSWTKNGNTGFGLSRVTKSGQELLIAPAYNWGVYYTEILRGMLTNTAQAEYRQSSRAVNYFWGMSEGVVDLMCSELLPSNVQRLVSFLESSIVKGASSPFTGVFRTQNGDVIGEEGKALTTEEIVNMDYLADNIIGVIPKYSELTPTGKEIVDNSGVEPSTRETAL